jgi:hypothetical protein
VISSTDLLLLVNEFLIMVVVGVFLRRVGGFSLRANFFTGVLGEYERLPGVLVLILGACMVFRAGITVSRGFQRSWELACERGQKPRRT